MIIVYEPTTLAIRYTVNDPVPRRYSEVLEKHNLAAVDIKREDMPDTLSQLYLTTEEDEVVVKWRDSFNLGDASISLGQTYRASVPEGTEVYLDGDSIGVIEDGLLEFEAEEEGAYTLGLDHPHYIPLSITVLVN